MDESLSFNRFKPSQLVYVELESTNGGMLLSASEEGFSFRAVTPLRPSGPVAFAFLLDGKTRLEGKGKLVWSEEDGKRGGILFTEVTPQFRREFESWLRRKEGRRGIAEAKPERPPSPQQVADSKPKPPAAQPDVNIASPTTAAPAIPAAPKLRQKEILAETSSEPLLEDLERALKKAALRAEKPQTTAPPPSLPSLVAPEIIAPDKLEEPPAFVPPVIENAKPNVVPAVVDAQILEIPPAAPPIREVAADTPEKPSLPEQAAEPETVKTPEPPAADTMEKVSRGFRLEFVPESKPLEAALPPTDFPAPKETAISAQLPRVALNLAAPPAALQPEAPSSEPESPASSIEPHAEIQPEAVTPPEEPQQEKETVAAVSETGEPEIAAPRIPLVAMPRESPAESQGAREDPAIELLAEAESSRERSAAIRRHWGRTAATAFVWICVGWALALLAMGFRKQIGEELIRLGQKIAGEQIPTSQSLPLEGSKQTSAQASNSPQQPANNSPANPSSTAEQQPATQLGQARGQPGNTESGDAGNSATSPPNTAGSGVVNPSGGTAPPGMVISATGQKEFEEARRILHGKFRSRDMEEAVELLLAAVSRGNVRAEVTLGDLYARGEGVPKDCAQARILLEAAGKRGSPEARQLLGKLKSEGCP